MRTRAVGTTRRVSVVENFAIPIPICPPGITTNSGGGRVALTVVYVALAAIAIFQAACSGAGSITLPCAKVIVSLHSHASKEHVESVAIEQIRRIKRRLPTMRPQR